MIKKIISFLPIEIVAILLIISIPAVGITVFSNKVSKSFENRTAQSSPTPSITESSSPSTDAELDSTTNNLLKSPNAEVLGENATNFNPPPVTGTSPTNQILSLSELAILPTNNDPLMRAIQNAYSEFLQTPNLIYLTSQQQRQLYEQIAKRHIQNLVDQQKAQLQQQLNDVNQKLYSLPQPSSQPYIQDNTSYQTCLNSKSASIKNNPYLSQSAMQLQIEKAQQDCANQ